MLVSLTLNGDITLLSKCSYISLCDVVSMLSMLGFFCCLFVFFFCYELNCDCPSWMKSFIQLNSAFKVFENKPFNFSLELPLMGEGKLIILGI